MPPLRLDPASFLFVTLDSCRYDTFASARTPALGSVGALHRAIAPGNFTYSSHSAMFMGFTPGIADRVEPFLNPKYGKIFKVASRAFSAGNDRHFAHLEGRNVIDGLKNAGCVAIGTGAVSWFDPEAPTSETLTRDFDHFFYPGDRHSLARQLDFIDRKLSRYEGRKVFVFLNVGETHVPYYHEGAPWDPTRNPCVPFGEDNDADECRRRQRLCLEHVDAALAPLVETFGDANVLICADHGDAWGEDGLWEHGIHHRAVLEVPLLFRLTRTPAPAEEDEAPGRRGMRVAMGRLRRLAGRGRKRRR